jgi:myo-inositol 2-dehydrogenase/D-chiro-inositol 1-dehydrogenase
MASLGIDAVLIASPGPAHEPAPRVMAAEQRLGHRQVRVGFMRRYEREYIKLKSLLDSGELGRPLTLHNRHRNPDSAPGFTSAMVINDSVAHEMDVIRWLPGQEVTAVTVMRPRPSASAPEGLADPQFVVFETEGGALVDVEIYVNARYGYQVQAEAVREDGTARIGDRHDILVNTGGRWGGTVTSGFVERFEEAYDRQVQAWVDATRRGGVTGPSVWDRYAVAAISEAGVRAQTEGRHIEGELVDLPALYR